MQYDFGFPIRPTLRLCEIEEILRRTRAVVPVPTRPTLIKLIEDGTLQGLMPSHSQFGYVVYEDSFKAWVRNLQQ
jgi:hypothetical protein